MRLRTFSVAILVALSAGCVSPRHIVVSDYCMIAQPITFTESDLAVMTESIARQIESHNWQIEVLCESR